MCHLVGTTSVASLGPRLWVGSSDRVIEPRHLSQDHPQIGESADGRRRDAWVEDRCCVSHVSTVRSATVWVAQRTVKAL